MVVVLLVVLAVAWPVFAQSKNEAPAKPQGLTGLLTPFPEVLEAVLRQDALSIVDAVASLGGHDMREWTSGATTYARVARRSTSALPDLAYITLSKAAIQVMQNRDSMVQGLYFNLPGMESHWGQNRSYHHTAPIPMTHALHEALRMMMDEGIENRINHHARAAALLRAELDALGLELLTNPHHWINPLITVRIPGGIEDTAVRGSLQRDYGGGLGEFRSKPWRNGPMVDSTRERNVFALLSASEVIRNANGCEFACGPSLIAAQKALDALTGRAA